MTWGKKKKEDPGTPSVSEVMRVKSKFESKFEGDTIYYSVQLEYPGGIFDKNRIETVELRPRSKEEFDVYEVGQRVTIGVQPWLTIPTEAADEEEEDLAS